MLSAASGVRARTRGQSSSIARPSRIVAPPVDRIAPVRPGRAGNAGVDTGFDASHHPLHALAGEPGPSHTRLGLRTGAQVGRRDRLIHELRAQGAALRTLADTPAAAPAQGALEQAIAQTQRTLQTQESLDFLSNTMHALGAPARVVETLDGAVPITVAARTRGGSDAQYDPATGTIVVSRQLLDDVTRREQQLRQQGVVDANGNVLQPAALDASPVADAVVKTATLLGVHEATHAAQDASGVVARVDRAQSAARAAAQELAAKLPPDLANQVLAAAERSLAQQRVRLEEYEAYRNQEHMQFELGASTRTHLTQGADGSNLPVAQAVANIEAFTAHDAAPSAAAVTAQPGWRMPGDAVDGWRMPGDAVHGRRMPGDAVDGWRMPGDTVHGWRMPGDAVR